MRFSQIVGESMDDRGSAPGRCDRHRRAGAWSASRLATGTRSTADSTRKSPNRKKYSADGAPMFPAATSPIGGSRTTRSFFPPASATRSAGWAARTVGWISARAPGRPYWPTTPPKTPRRRLKNAPGPAPGRARSRCPSRTAGPTSGDSGPRAWAMTVYAISPASACGNIRPRSWENSRSLPTCSAASPIPKTCPSSLTRC